MRIAFDHLPNLKGQAFDSRNQSPFTKTKRLCNLELCLKFTIRSASDPQKLPKFAPSQPTLPPLRYCYRRILQSGASAR